MNQSDVSLYNKVTISLDGDITEIKSSHARTIAQTAVTIESMMNQMKVKQREIEDALRLIKQLEV